MNAKENYLRAAEMTGPEWIPCTISVSPPVWHKYREQLRDLVLRHPSLFDEYQKGNRDYDYFGVRRKGNTITDEWGCVWSFLADGLQGQVVKHPLEDLKLLASFKPQDPIQLNNVPGEGYPPYPNSFEMAMNYLKKAKKEDKLAVGSCPHGFMFQRLYYLRGFTNLMKDFVLQPPELNKLVDVVLDYNMKLIRRWLEVDIDLLSCGDDVGMQDRLVINPRTFRKYLVPAYSTMFGAARERGVHVFLHSDGHILEVAEDLVKAGVTILNPQDLVNGVENIKTKLKGRVCIDIDIDRQKVVPFGKPAAIKKHVRNVISALNSPEGGLMVTVGIYPPTPLENIEALCEALEEAGAGPRS
jgi:hypothetical protein